MARIELVAADRAVRPEEVNVEHVGHPLHRAGRYFADLAVRKLDEGYRRLWRWRVRLLVVGEGRDLDNVAAHQVAGHVYGMAAAGEKRAHRVMPAVAPTSGVARLDDIVPVVGLDEKRLAKRAIGDERLDRLDQRVPAQNKAHHGTHTGRLDRRLHSR